jgi:hypothetical protein
MDRSNLRYSYIIWTNHGMKCHPHAPGRHAAASVGAAVTILLCFHWYSLILHTRDYHDARFLPSSSSSSPRPPRSSSSSSAGGGGGGRAPPDDAGQRRRSSPRVDDGGIGVVDRGEPYILGNSSVCAGCFRSYTDDGGGGTTHCLSLIEGHTRQNASMSFVDAARRVGEEAGGGACGICDPERCRTRYLNATAAAVADGGGGLRMKYWRFDRAGPEFENPTTLFLRSIPDAMRIPPARFGDIGEYFRERFKLARGDNSSLDFLVEYNPGLVRIPSGALGRLPEGAKYLLSLRATPANNCFAEEVYRGLDPEVSNAVYITKVNHLALALLDGELRTMPGYEAVIDLGRDLDLTRRNVKSVGGPVFMDYRLFVLNDEIYLHANADTVVVSRLSLGAGGAGGGGGDDNVRSCADRAREAAEERRWGWEVPCRLGNLYGQDNGGGLRVTLMRQFNTVWSGGREGKNYALFSLPNATHLYAPGPVYAEIDIFPRHRVQRILPDVHDEVPKTTIFERLWKPGTNKSRKDNIDRVNMRQVREVGNATSSDGAPPLPSFFNVDAHEDWFPGASAPFKESAHGGACCVSFSADELNSGDTTGRGGDRRNSGKLLLVGIAHTKVSWKPWYSRPGVPQEEKDRVPHTHYVTLFYAFDAYPPFKVRARSGYFCLGHAPPSPSGQGGELPPTEGGVFNPHSVLTRNRMLRQNNVTFDCPQISYVSSFIEKAGDTSRTIVGYGMNDCTGRLVEVRKSEIARLLYPDPMDMIFEGERTE